MLDETVIGVLSTGGASVRTSCYVHSPAGRPTPKTTTCAGVLDVRPASGDLPS